MSNIQFTPPKAESKVDPELANHVNTMHQLLFDRLTNHFNAINTLQGQVTALQAQVKTLQGS